MDAGSDVGDWFSALKWDDGTALIVVGLMVSTILVSFVKWRLTKGKQNKLQEFHDSGDAFLRGIKHVAGASFPTIEDIRSWVRTTAAYLEKRLGPGAAATFLGEDVREPETVDGSFGIIRARLKALRDLLAELRR